MEISKKQVKQLLEVFRNHSYDELLVIGATSAAKLLPVFERVTGDKKEGTMCLIMFIGTSLAADGELSNLEAQFVTDLLGVSKENIKALVENMKSSPTYVEVVDKIFDACMYELADEILKFCCCILAVDKEVDEDEVRFVKRLLDYN